MNDLLIDLNSFDQLCGAGAAEPEPQNISAAPAVAEINESFYKFLFGSGVAVSAITENKDFQDFRNKIQGSNDGFGKVKFYSLRRSTNSRKK